MAYDLTCLDSANSLFATFNCFNEMTSGGLTAVVLLVFGMILYVGLADYEVKQRMVGVSLTLSILAALAFFMELIGVRILLIPIVGLFASLIAMNSGGNN